MSRRVTVAFGVLLSLAVSLPMLVSALYTSVGYVRLNRAQLASEGNASADYAAAAEAFTHAGEWLPSGERWRIGLALTRLQANDSAGALQLLRDVSSGNEDDPVLQGHLLRAARGARDPQQLLDTYRRASAPALLREYRAAAAAAAVNLAANDGSHRAEYLMQSLEIWPDNLCALAAGAAAANDRDGIAALRASTFDGAYAPDDSYRECLRTWIPRLAAVDSELRAIVARDVSLADAVPADPWSAPALTPEIIATLAAQSLDRALTPSWRLQGFALAGASATADNRTVWIRVTAASADASPPPGAIRAGESWMIALRAANRLRNGGFELGTGVGPYVPWGFERVGVTSPGFHVIRDGETKAVAFAPAQSAAELRQQVNGLTPGNLLLFTLAVRADRPVDPNFGVAVYAYWTTEIGSRNGYTRVMSGLSAYPDWRTIGLLAEVPPFTHAAEVAFSSTLSNAQAQLDDVWLADLTREFLHASDERHNSSAGSRQQ